MFKIKRYEFGIDMILIALFAAVSGISLLSAYGAVCVTWNPMFYGMPSFSYVGNNILVMQTMNIITWITSFLTASLIFALLVKWSWTWLVSVVSSGLGFIAGLIPALIADTKGFTTAFSMGSPHWAKTMVNLILLIVVLLPWSRTSINAYIESETKLTGNIGKQLVIIATIFFYMSLVSFIGSEFLAEAHVIEGINVWELVEIQTYGAYINLIGGISTLSAGLTYMAYNQIKPSPSLVRI